jgi:predicted porin
MKKSLIAVAVLAATTGAFAQSSVTLYGRLDLGMASNKSTSNPGGAVVADTTVKSFDLAGAQGTRTGSRLGVRGTEDLGGGLKASFNIETRVNPDSSASTFGTTRNGNLSLAGGFGTVTLGTYDNALDDVRGYSASTASVAGGDFLSNNSGFIDGRSQNSLGYRSPAFGGFYVRADIVNRKNQVTVPATPLTKSSGFGMAVGYDNGPLSALVAFAKSKDVEVPVGNPTFDSKTQDFGFGVSYDFGFAVPYFQFEQSKNSDIPGPVTNQVRAFEIGSKFPLGAFTPYITLSRAKEKSNVANTGKANGFQIGTTYDISKRTYAYAAFGSDKGIETNVAPGNVAGFQKNRGYALGLVHSF